MLEHGIQISFGQPKLPVLWCFVSNFFLKVYKRFQNVKKSAWDSFQADFPLILVCFTLKSKLWFKSYEPFHSIGNLHSQSRLNEYSIDNSTSQFFKAVRPWIEGWCYQGQIIPGLSNCFHICWCEWGCMVCLFKTRMSFPPFNITSASPCDQIIFEMPLAIRAMVPIEQGRLSSSCTRQSRWQREQRNLWSGRIWKGCSHWNCRPVHTSRHPLALSENTTPIGFNLLSQIL